MVTRWELLGFYTIAGAICIHGAAGVQAQPGSDIDDGLEVLARGPMHEAFAAPVVFDPVPGMVVSSAPPEAIEELPPDEQPEGDNVIWVDGYWNWDDDSSSYIWISGIWRDVPPDREWVPGYWLSTSGGAQWISGYWRSLGHEVVEYLPSPPASIEIGPSSEPPSELHIWAPGCWIWRDARYVWRPGYWVVNEPDWVWVPAHYVWTPRGCIYIDGYWDYAPVRRGVVFAPVRMTSVVYTRPGYVYRPRVAIDVTVAIDHFFARPRCRHYYYGDYYADTYVKVGIYPSFSFHYSRYGYDPIFARERVVHRRTNPKWELSVRAEFSRRREHVHLRPARVYSHSHTSVSIARPFAEYRQTRSAEIRFRKTSPEQISRARRSSSELKDYRRIRATNESYEKRTAPGVRSESQVRRTEMPRSKTQAEGRRRPDTARRLPQRPDRPNADPNRKATPGRQRPMPTDRMKHSDRRPKHSGKRSREPQNRKAREKKRP